MSPPTTAQSQYAQLITQQQLDKNTTSAITTVKSTLDLQPHPEGGYFVETDRDTLKIPNPFKGTPIYPSATITTNDNPSDTDETLNRNASTTIHYYLDQTQPNGVFHRNKGRTVHTLHWGRGIYVIIHADELSKAITSPVTSTLDSNQHPFPLLRQQARIETFTVGPNIEAGEKLQWIVEGGKFKASFLLPDSNTCPGDQEDDTTANSVRGLLISETVVPGFEFMDHDFLTLDGLRDLVGEEQAKDLKWLVKK